MEKAKNIRVVAIGASKGGLAAFQKLVENLPTNTGMAFVLLSHILRDSKSFLPEILSRSTKMQVIQVTDGIGLLANHVYVLPPNKLMEIREGHLYLVPRPETGGNNSIDHFLFSLAEDRALGSIGIILSGEGSDGSEGIKVLKEKAGGVTMAQEPASAKSKSMPINAIEIDHVDHILTPEDIAHQLASMSWCNLNIKNTPLKVMWMGHSNS
ncbi:MAG: chemotaxis protein CheB [Pseudomonadota bacterium]|nr:chemotaxis protein CheB [Pseudomonadota bacterium]